MANGKKNGVWYASIDRFGYSLETVAKTKDEAVLALMEAYRDAFKNQNNGMDPTEEQGRYGTGSYYEEALDDVVVRFMPFCEVEWR